MLARFGVRVGYTHRTSARDAVQRALQQTLQEPADELRRLEPERLDSMLAAIWPQAMAGKLLAIDRCLRIMERRAQLLGLVAPQRRSVNVITEDVIDAEIRRLEQDLAANDQADVAG